MLDFDHATTYLITNGTSGSFYFNLLISSEMNDIALFGHLIWIKSNGISKTCGFSFNLQRVYVATSRQLKRIESVSRSPIFNNFFETINGASTIRAFGQQQRLIRDNYYRVDENHVAFYPGTSANRCVNTIRLFILTETFVNCDVIMVCFFEYFDKYSCCWVFYMKFESFGSGWKCMWKKKINTWNTHCATVENIWGKSFRVHFCP